MTGVAVVTFDCWNTLLSDTAADAARAGQISAVDAAAGGALGPARAAEILDAAVAEHTTEWRAGRHHGLERIVARLGSELDLDAATMTRLTEALSTVAPETIEATPGAAATMDALHEAGYLLALVCDTGLRPGAVVRRLLAAHDLLGRLDALAFSDEVGVPKPDRRMFAAALEPLGGDPSRSAHVGDLVATDVAGAHAAGMCAVLFTGITPPEVAHAGSDQTPDASIDRLPDLPAVLEAA